MKNGRPEEEKIRELIDEFEEYIGKDRDNWRQMIRNFIVWMYIEKKFIIIPQDKMQSSISDVHLG